jgi:hypothetical protein
MLPKPPTLLSPGIRFKTAPLTLSKLVINKIRPITSAPIPLITKAILKAFCACRNSYNCAISGLYKRSYFTFLSE